MMHRAVRNVEDMPCNLFRSSIKLQGQGLKNRRFEFNLIKITRPVAAFKSLRFALLEWRICNICHWHRAKCRFWANFVRSWVLICTTGPMMFQKYFASKRANFLAMTHSWNGWAPTDRYWLSAWTRNPPCWRTRHWAAWGHITVHWQHCICQLYACALHSNIYGRCSNPYH